MSTDAVAILGFVALFALMLLRVPVGMAMGLVGVSGFGLSRGWNACAEACRPDIDAHGDRLYLRCDPDVLADGHLRQQFRHEPRTVPRRQRFCRASARRARDRDRRGLRGFCRDLRLVGRDRCDILGGGLPGDAPLRLSAILCDRRDRRRGTLGAMLPPSTVLAVYGIITEQDIGKLFMAGIVPACWQ